MSDACVTLSKLRQSGFGSVPSYDSRAPYSHGLVETFPYVIFNLKLAKFSRFVAYDSTNATEVVKLEVAFPEQCVDVERFLSSAFVYDWKRSVEVNCFPEKAFPSRPAPSRNHGITIPGTHKYNTRQTVKIKQTLFRGIIASTLSLRGVSEFGLFFSWVTSFDSAVSHRLVCTQKFWKLDFPFLPFVVVLSGAKHRAYDVLSLSLVGLASYCLREARSIRLLSETIANKHLSLPKLTNPLLVWESIYPNELGSTSLICELKEKPQPSFA